TYDAASGIFRWTGKPRVGVTNGKVAGSYKPSGCRIRINRIEYKASRLAWLYTYGRWPDGEVGYVNGDPSDIRILNLRDGSHSQIVAHSKRRTDNSSGLKGV